MAKTHLQRAHERIARVREENLTRKRRTGQRWSGTARLELVVDGRVVDLVPGGLGSLLEFCAAAEANGKAPSPETMGEVIRIFSPQKPGGS